MSSDLVMTTLSSGLAAEPKACQTLEPASRNDIEKGASKETGGLAAARPAIERRQNAYFSSFSAPRRLSAAPRMSPRLAPESDEPYSAIAFFSSSNSRALIDRLTLRVAR